MTHWRALKLLVVLALVSAGGIVGMLLADGLWDAAFLLLTALPLLVGGWRFYSLRDGTSRDARSFSGQRYD